jgi:hypothetical protein
LSGSNFLAFGSAAYKSADESKGQSDEAAEAAEQASIWRRVNLGKLTRSMRDIAAISLRQDVH